MENPCGTTFALREKVIVDGDSSLKGRITAILLRPNGISYEVSYIHNGIAYAPWIEEFRLTPV